MIEPDETLIGQVEAAIGPKATAALCQTFGGRRLHIPKQHRIAEAIGAEAAGLLSRLFGGLRLDVPSNYGREQRVRELLEKGWGPAKIAAAVPCSERWVYSIRKAMEEEA